MKKYTVSVLTYRRDAMLKICIDSLLKMKVKPNEILIIDQNSTDRLRKEISRYGTKNKGIRFTYVFMGNAHISKGRKKALETARYDYLLFTDDDCAVDRDWSYHALRALANNPLVAGKCLRDMKNDSLVSRTLHEQTERFFSMYKTKTKEGRIQSYLMDPKNCAIDRRVVRTKKIMYDPEQFWLEDMDFAFQAYMKKVPILSEEKMIVTHTYIHTMSQAMKSQFKLGLAFETLFRRWRNTSRVRALYMYASHKDMQDRGTLMNRYNPLLLLFSLSRNAGYLFGTIRSFIFGT